MLSYEEFGVPYSSCPHVDPTVASTNRDACPSPLPRRDGGWAADRTVVPAPPCLRLTAGGSWDWSLSGTLVCLPARRAVIVCWWLPTEIWRGCRTNYGILISVRALETDRPGLYPNTATYVLCFSASLPQSLSLSSLKWVVARSKCSKGLKSFM